MITAAEASKISDQNLFISDILERCESAIQTAAKAGARKVTVYNIILPQQHMLCLSDKLESHGYSVNMQADKLPEWDSNVEELLQDSLQWTLWIDWSPRYS